MSPKGQAGLAGRTGRNGIRTTECPGPGPVVRRRTPVPDKEASARGGGGGRTPGELRTQWAPGSQTILHAKEQKLCLTVKSGTEDSSSKGHKVKSEF